ncbi:MAG: hypothetical protein LBS36_08105 [Oscillospiraceae bacterium]|jgi:hypothetical protein|nr:hypothetical protein [Oscillospiraceae bacterium]
MSILLQVERLIAGAVESNANVIFDSTVTSSGNISYDSVTGVITILEAGRYEFDWWVATQASVSTIGAGFALVSSQGDTIIGNSPTKTGEVVGVGVIEVVTAPVTVALTNNSSATIYYSTIVPVNASLAVIGTDEAVLAFGSLRGSSVETPGATFTPVPFNVSGPLSDTVTVSLSGNELVVGESGIYQVTISINAEATTDPDPDQPYLNAIITVNGVPIFGDTTTFFKISNRSSSTFVVQAALTAGDEVGASISTDFPILGYMNRSLTIVQLSN